MTWHVPFIVYCVDLWLRGTWWLHLTVADKPFCKTVRASMLNLKFHFLGLQSHNNWGSCKPRPATGATKRSDVGSWIQSHVVTVLICAALPSCHMMSYDFLIVSMGLFFDPLGHREPPCGTVDWKTMNAFEWITEWRKREQWGKSGQSVHFKLLIFESNSLLRTRLLYCPVLCCTTTVVDLSVQSSCFMSYQQTGFLTSSEQLAPMMPIRKKGAANQCVSHSHCSLLYLLSWIIHRFAVLFRLGLTHL